MSKTDGSVAMQSDLPERARRVGRLAASEAAAAEAQGQLTEAVVDALHDEGLWALWVPASVGGAELDVLSSLEVVESLSYGDPSVGWVLMATGLITATTAAYCGDEAVEALFVAGERIPVIAGHGTLPGTAVPCRDGFSLSGSWSFGSGMKHATHTHNLARIEGTDEMRIFVTGIEDAGLMLDSWDVLGLRATGSIDYVIESVFVPEAFSHPDGAAASPRGGPLYNLGIIGFVTLGHAGWALGLGRRLLDELIANVEAKGGRPGSPGGNPAFLEGFAKAEAKLRAARALTYEVWSEVAATFEAGDELSVHQQTMIRLSLTNATWSVHEVAEFVYLSGGTSALRTGTIQKLFRDIHAGTQHVSSGPVIRQNTGLGLLGSLADGKVWRFITLADDDG
jgi:alkylation response protein AidB-like acyl-CoA dehydrogenase